MQVYQAELLSGNKNHSAYLKQKRNLMHGIRNIKINERLEQQGPGCRNGSGTHFQTGLPFVSPSGRRTTGPSQGLLTSRAQSHSCAPGTRMALGCYCAHLSSLRKLRTQALEPDPLGFKSKSHHFLGGNLRQVNLSVPQSTYW